MPVLPFLLEEFVSFHPKSRNILAMEHHHTDQQQFSTADQEKHFLWGRQDLIYSKAPELPQKLKNKETNISSLVTAMADVGPYKGENLVLTGEAVWLSRTGKKLYQKYQKELGFMVFFFFYVYEVLKVLK